MKDKFHMCPLRSVLYPVSRLCTCSFDSVLWLCGKTMIPHLTTPVSRTTACNLHSVCGVAFRPCPMEMLRTGCMSCLGQCASVGISLPAQISVESRNSLMTRTPVGRMMSSNLLRNCPPRLSFRNFRIVGSVRNVYTSYHTYHLTCVLRAFCCSRGLQMRPSAESAICPLGIFVIPGFQCLCRRTFFVGQRPVYFLEVATSAAGSSAGSSSAPAGSVKSMTLSSSDPTPYCPFSVCSVVASCTGSFGLLVSEFSFWSLSLSSDVVAGARCSPGCFVLRLGGSTVSRPWSSSRRLSLDFWYKSL